MLQDLGKIVQDIIVHEVNIITDSEWFEELVKEKVLEALKIPKGDGEIKTTVHCEDCDSPRLIMLNANCTWDVEEQRWEYSENYDPLYQCAECGADNINFTEKEIVNA